MKISIIIPTHNRADLLKNVIDNVLKLKDEADFEFVIVDNNSTDTTKSLVESYSKYAKYVFEKCTSFTKARSTGAENSSGDVLLYLDDDVIVNPGSLKNISRIFSKYPECGVLAGRILPKYLEEPPQWTLDCQIVFNGWSLYDIDPSTYSNADIKEVTWAAGPMMAIRKTVSDAVGGFPPDTIGVETNSGKRLFNKLYIGPGDYGLCKKVIDKGWKVYYNNDVSVYHIIPPVRFTVKFWRSRMIGEGYHEAITQREFFKLDSFSADVKRQKFQILLQKYEHDLINKISIDKGEGGVSIEELWVFYYKAYLDMDAVIRKHKDLPAFLWKIGLEGVDDSNFDSVMSHLPNEFKQLVSDEYVYNNISLRSQESYNAVVTNFNTHNQRLLYSNTLFFTVNKLIRKIVARF